MAAYFFFFCCLSALLYSKAHASEVSVEGVEIPEDVWVDDRILMQCDFDVDGGGGRDVAYTVKWFLNDKEFYRYGHTPGRTPQKEEFDVPGAEVDLGASTADTVVLSKVSCASDGAVKCQVSTDDGTAEAEAEETLKVHTQRGRCRRPEVTTRPPGGGRATNSSPLKGAPQLLPLLGWAALLLGLRDKLMM